ncbi:hypothetical protein ACVWYP_000174 [Bradyrhizobium sp. USDA 3262]
MPASQSDSRKAQTTLSGHSVGRGKRAETGLPLFAPAVSTATTC